MLELRPSYTLLRPPRSRQPPLSPSALLFAPGDFHYLFDYRAYGRLVELYTSTLYPLNIPHQSGPVSRESGKSHSIARLISPRIDRTQNFFFSFDTQSTEITLEENVVSVIFRAMKDKTVSQSRHGRD